jgi:hypothetical protein
MHVVALLSKDNLDPIIIGDLEGVRNGNHRHRGWRFRPAGYTIMPPGSVVFRVMSGHDDLVGRQVKAEIFRGEKRICISVGDLAEWVKMLAGERLIETEPIKSYCSLMPRSS